MQSGTILDASKHSPLALVVVTSYDDRNVFLKDNDLSEHVETRIKRIREAGYNVVVRRAATDQEVANTIAEIGSKEKIAFLDLEAHGNPRSMSYGQGEADESELDTGDFDEGMFKGFGQYFTDEALIRLVSCSTGKPLDGERCFAQRLAEAVEREVEAPIIDIWGSSPFTTSLHLVGRSEGNKEFSIKRHGDKSYFVTAVDSGLPQILPFAYFTIEEGKIKDIFSHVHNYF